ncbi:Uma2 family endonuclease, partial [Streptomyces sp. MCAF7]
MAHEPLTQEELLLEGFLALGTPEGFRAELIEGEIVVTPPPDGDHEDHISDIVNQVIRKSVTNMDFSGNKGLKVPRGELCVRNYVIPDGTFAPREQRLFRGAESWMDCE